MGGAGEETFSHPVTKALAQIHWDAATALHFFLSCIALYNKEKCQAATAPSKSASNVDRNPYTLLSTPLVTDTFYWDIRDQLYPICLPCVLYKYTKSLPSYLFTRHHCWYFNNPEPGGGLSLALPGLCVAGGQENRFQISPVSLGSGGASMSPGTRTVGCMTIHLQKQTWHLRCILSCQCPAVAACKGK